MLPNPAHAVPLYMGGNLRTRPGENRVIMIRSAEIGWAASGWSNPAAR